MTLPAQAIDDFRTPALAFLGSANLRTPEACLLVNELTRLSADPLLALDARAWDRAADEAMLDAGFGVGLADALAYYEDARQNDLGFWAGVYALVASDRSVYRLDVFPHSVVLLELATQTFWSADAALEDGRLALQAGLPWSLTLAFEAPGETALDDPEFRCRGSFHRAGEDAAGVDLIGKRNCYTAAGVSRDRPGDPIEAWNGCYAVGATGTDARSWEWSPDALRVESHGERPYLQWGETVFEDARWAGNTLLARQGARQLSIGFDMTDADVPRCAIRDDRSSVVRHWLGFWTEPATMHAGRRRAPQAAAAAAPALLLRPSQLPPIIVGSAYSVDLSVIPTGSASDIVQLTCRAGTLPPGLLWTPSSGTDAAGKLSGTLKDRALIGSTFTIVFDVTASGGAATTTTTLDVAVSDATQPLGEIRRIAVASTIAYWIPIGLQIVTLVAAVAMWNKHRKERPITEVLQRFPQHMGTEFKRALHEADTETQDRIDVLEGQAEFWRSRGEDLTAQLRKKNRDLADMEVELERITHDRSLDPEQKEERERELQDRIEHQRTDIASSSSRHDKTEAERRRVEGDKPPRRKKKDGRR